MEVRSILRRDRANLHTQPLASRGMFYDCFCADLSFLDQEMEVQQITFAFPRACFYEESRGTQVFDP